MSHRVFSASENRIVAKDITDAREKIVRVIWNNGARLIDQRGEATREIVGLEVIVMSGELRAGQTIMLQAEDFATGVLNDYIALKKGEEFDYSYGERLRRAKQLDNVIELLKTDPSTRRAYLPIFQPIDNFSDVEKPCWASLQFVIRNGRLDLIDYFRSNECCIAIPSDMYGAYKLLDYVAAEVGVMPGWIYHYIACAHLRESDYDTIKPLLG
jgi:thymidylate synthase